GNGNAITLATGCAQIILQGSSSEIVVNTGSTMYRCSFGDECVVSIINNADVADLEFASLITIEIDADRSKGKVWATTDNEVYLMQITSGAVVLTSI
ncbi:hypothetical protein, partial [Bradyrhizobium diazoefficiens]